MAATYCTEAQVISQVGIVDPADPTSRITLTTSTIPKLLEVTELIEDAEDFIDNFCSTSWKTVTVTDERHSFSLNNTYWRSVIRGNGFYIQLNNRYIVSITKIELWQGQDYTDVVAIGTEGTGQQSGDWFLEYEHGLLWVNTDLPAFGEGTIKITYDYGQTSAVPKTIRRATILLAAAWLIEAGFDYNNINITNNDSMNNSEKAERWETRAYVMLNTEIVPPPIPQR